ncbi:MAG: hypothetical protein WA144_07030 [Candidatus Methanoperedens sp.]
MTSPAKLRATNVAPDEIARAIGFTGTSITSDGVDFVLIPFSLVGEVLKPCQLEAHQTPPKTESSQAQARPWPLSFRIVYIVRKEMHITFTPLS